MNSEPLISNREQRANVLNGWVMLPIVVILALGSIGMLIYSIAQGVRWEGHPIWALLILSLLLEFCSIVMFPGFFTLQPNEARVLILFGAYKGTVRDAGFHWGNPFYSNGLGQASGRRGIELERNIGPGKPSVNIRFRKPSRFKISLRTRNFNGDKLKVNDKRGNPIEIAAVVVWRVQDTAQAIFDVEDFETH